MVGDYTRCLSNLIKFEAQVLKHPLTIHQLLIPEANLIKLSNKNYNSCRSEVVMLQIEVKQIIKPIQKKRISKNIKENQKKKSEYVI